MNENKSIDADKEIKQLAVNAARTRALLLAIAAKESVRTNSIH